MTDSKNYQVMLKEVNSHNLFTITMLSYNNTVGDIKKILNKVWININNNCNTGI